MIDLAFSRMEDAPVLKGAYEAGKISLSDITALIVANEEKKLKGIPGLDLRKIGERDNGKRVYIHLRKELKELTGQGMVSAASREELIHKLYVLFFESSNTITLNKAFDSYLRWRLDVGTKAKTMKEDMFEWNRFFRDTIGPMRLQEIKMADIRDTFLRMTAGNAITRNRFMSAKGVLMGVLGHAVEQEWIQVNPAAVINLKAFRKRFKPVDERHDNYSRDEVVRIVRYLRNVKDPDVYDYAVRFAFLSCIRIGELKALRYEDIGTDTFSINSSISEEPSVGLDEKNKVCFGPSERVEHEVKGAASAGFRDMPLTDEAREIAEHLHDLYPENEYLFMSNGGQIATVTFNRRIKKVCEALRIKYRSSHGIRFTNSDALYFEGGIGKRDMQGIMGHTSMQMTEHYFNRHGASEAAIRKARNYLEVR